MPDHEFPDDQDRLATFLRESINRFMARLDIWAVGAGPGPTRCGIPSATPSAML